MKKYIKNGIIKQLKEIIIKSEGKVIINPSEQIVLENGWVEYIKPEPTLDTYKWAKIEEINNYDSSNSVNVFYMSEQPIWLDKQTRTGLMLRFQAESGMGQTTTSLWYEGEEFILPLDMAIQMLYAIEIYASKCYDNTQKHIANVDALDSIEDVKNYDYTTGYPEHLYL